VAAITKFRFIRVALPKAGSRQALVVNLAVVSSELSLVIAYDLLSPLDQQLHMRVAHITNRRDTLFGVRGQLDFESCQGCPIGACMPDGYGEEPDKHEQTHDNLRAVTH
jgi:hypothetical protein